MRVARLPILSAAAVMLAGGGAWASPLLPHRAVYDLALDEASDRSGITGITGRMVYEFNGSACEGYTVTFRFVTQIDTSEASRLTDQQTTTYEDGSGDNFTFVTRSFVDQALDTKLRGKAHLESGETVVTLSEPKQAELRLEETQFPTQHLIELIGKAEQGENFYETTIFDGSDEADEVMTTTVVIGHEARVGPNDPERKAVDGLAGDPFWPVDIAYFDMDEVDGEEMPTYRISFKLHESGVTRDLVMDYGDFSMSGRLVDLAMFDPPAACPE
jgi:hypothetical protein